MPEGEHDRNDTDGQAHSSQPLHCLADRGPGAAGLKVSGGLVRRKLVDQFLFSLSLLRVGAADVDFEILRVQWRREHADQRQIQDQRGNPQESK
jgi:hypothetical protein